MPASLASTTDSEIALAMGVFLAGLADEEETAARLDIGLAELRALLHDLSLTERTMMPVGMSQSLEAVFLDMGDQTFDAPAFDDIVTRVRAAGEGCHAMEFRLPARAVIDALPPLAPCPRGVMLHVGRCGSTLLCNLIAKTTDWVALREPEFLNTLVLARAATSDPGQISRVDALLERLIDALTRATRPRSSIVKLSSWTTVIGAPLIGRLNHAKIVVVVRDPWATTASFLDQPPHWYGRSPPDGQFSETERVSAARFFAESWRSTAEAACRLPRDQTVFIYYEDIVEHPQDTVHRVLHHLADKDPLFNAEPIAQIMAAYSKSSLEAPFDRTGAHRRSDLDSNITAIVTAIAEKQWHNMKSFRNRLLAE